MSCKIKVFVDGIVAAHPPGPKPGVVCVIIASESAGSTDGVPALDVEGCVRVHAARTELGGRLLQDFGRRMKAAVAQVLHDIAGEDEVVVLHDVLATGVRAKA